jgi:hypothetical protein
MTEKKTFLSEDDICLYCKYFSSGIYYNKKYKYFFEYLRWVDLEFVFTLFPDEAKEELEKHKNELTEEQLKICKEIWSDF